MSFGFGVGDFIAVGGLANKIYKQFSDASPEYQRISQDVKLLSTVHSNANQDVSREQLDSTQRAELDAINQLCSARLQELEDYLVKNKALSPDINSSRPSKIRRILGWDPKKIEQFRNQINLVFSLFNTFLERVTSDVVFDTNSIVDGIRKHQIDESDRAKYNAVLNWLPALDFSAQQEEYFRRREEGTCEWLFDSVQFQEWIGGDSKILFCPGIPGAGKTILASTVISRAQELCANDTEIGLAYIYCSFKRQAEQDVRSILLSIVKQLLQRLPGLILELENLFDTCKRDGIGPTESASWDCLIALTRRFKKTIVVVDAIDEYQSDKGQRQKLLSYILRLPEEGSGSIFATSRHIPEIKSTFEETGCISLNIKADDVDVQKCLARRMVELPSFVLRDKDLQESIIATIVKTAGGMFLISELYQKSLIGARSPKTLKKQLEKFPSGSDAYDFAYGEAMHRIESQNRNTKDLAMQALTWIVAAAEPLSINDLLIALAIEIGENEFDSENVSDITDVVSACAGLVTIEETSNIIRLVHYTTQEYLQRTIDTWSPNSNADVAAACVSCLMYDSAPQIQVSIGDGNMPVTYGSSFVKFCERNWGPQARLTVSKGEYPILNSLVVRYLANQEKLLQHNEEIKVFEDLSLASHLSEQYRPLLSGMHIAAQCNLVPVLRTFVTERKPVDICGEDGVTPLFVASAMGNADSVSFLLRNNAVFESKTQDGHTPLIAAFSRGDKKTIEHLLKFCGDFRSHQNQTFGLTVMLVAATVGDPDMVDLALHYGADPDVRDLEGRTPLMVASQRGWAGTACRLIEGGADINATSNEGMSVLDHLFSPSDESAWGGIPDRFYKARLAEYMFSRGGRFSENNYHSTIDRAFEYPAMTIIKQVIDQNIQPDMEGEEGLTLLMHCIKCSFYSVFYVKKFKDTRDHKAQGRLGSMDEMMCQNIKLLLEAGADPNRGDSSGMLPLLLVLSCDTTKAQKREKAELLLKAGANPDLRYGGYSTPRENASWYGFDIENNTIVEKKSSGPSTSS